MGGVPSVVKDVGTLSSGTAREKEAAAKALLQLAASGPERQVQLAQAGAIKPLVHLCGDSNSALSRELAAGCLSHLALHPDNKPKIADAGGIPTLVEMARSSHPECTVNGRGAAVVTCANLSSRCKANQTAIAAAGGIPALVAVARETDVPDQLRAWAAMAIGNVVLEHPENQSLAGKEGAIPVLLAHLTALDECASSLKVPIPGEGFFSAACRHRAPTAAATGGPSGATKLGAHQHQASAVKALNSLAFNHKDNQARITSADGLQLLVKYLKGTPGALAQERLETVKALCNIIGGNQERKDTFVEAGGISTLISMAKASLDSKGSRTALASSVPSVTREMRSAISVLLAQLSHHHTMSQARIVEAGGVSTLVELVKAGSMQGAVALGHLADGSDTNKTCIAEAGAIPALVHQTRNGTSQGMVWAMKALASLASEHPANRELISMAGGPSQLDLLGGMRMSVVRSTDKDAPVGSVPGGETQGLLAEEVKEASDDFRETTMEP